MNPFDLILLLIALIETITLGLAGWTLKSVIDLRERMAKMETRSERD